MMQGYRKEIVALSSILVLGIAVRFVHINQPFVDHWSYRQTDTAQIAENFFLNGWHILFPQINWAGNSPGFIGSEFPLVPFLASLLYPFFGVQDWIGRTVSLFFYALSIPPLWLLVRRINVSIGLLTILIYSFVPLSILTSRSFISDMAMLSLMLWALYAFQKWVESPQRKSLSVLAASFTTIAILIKLPAAMIAVPFAYIVFQKYGWSLFSKVPLWVFAAAVAILPALWYFHSYSVALANPPYHVFGEQVLGIVSIEKYLKIMKTLIKTSLTPLIAAFALAGILLSWRHKLREFHAWFIASILFAVAAGKGTLVHEWYLLQLVPVTAFFASVTVHSISVKFRQAPQTIFTLLFLIFFGFLSFTAIKKKYEPWTSSARHLGIELQNISGPDDLIAVIDRGDSTAIYYSKRRGWHFPPYLGRGKIKNSDDAIAELEALRQQGASFLGIIDQQQWWLKFYKEFNVHLNSNYQRVKNTEEYTIFDLRKKAAT